MGRYVAVALGVLLVFGGINSVITGSQKTQEWQQSAERQTLADQAAAEQQAKEEAQAQAAAKRQESEEAKKRQEAEEEKKRQEAERKAAEEEKKRQEAEAAAAAEAEAAAAKEAEEAAAKQAAADAPDRGSMTVYITNSGERYHVDGCSSLNKSKIPISLRDAVRNYGSCGNCNPPTL